MYTSVHELLLLTERVYQQGWYHNHDKCEDNVATFPGEEVDELRCCGRSRHLVLSFLNVPTARVITQETFQPLVTFMFKLEIK